MKQSDCFITVGNDFEGLKEAVRQVVSKTNVPEAAHAIIREIERNQILQIAEEEYKRTGKRLPKKLREDLAKRFHFSEKHIEHMVYKK